MEQTAGTRPFERKSTHRYVIVDSFSKACYFSTFDALTLDFLGRYFGLLRVEPKKIHISLVGCLRNHRGTQKKQKQRQDDSVHDEADYPYTHHLHDANDENEAD